MGKFIMFSALLFVILLIAGGISFMFSMQQIIRTNKSRELTQMLETEQIRLESSLNPEIAIVLKLANSPIVKKHLMNPTDPELEQIAREEMFSYRDAFSGYSIFWMNDIDKMFYSDENEPYFVDVDDPVNYWYHLTVRDTERYNFNINYNPDIDEIKLWINAPVFDEAHNAVGMVGTGIELSMFVNATYKNIDERTELYFFAADGKIFGARKEELIVSRANIADVLQGLNIDILAENKTLKQGEVKLFDIPNGIVSTGATSLSNWHFVAIMEYSLADYDLAMTVLFVVVFVVILFIFVIFNMFIARLLKSLQKATDVLVLTVKMREQGLIADNEMLDRMNQMKYEFFQNMSHDIKTPLTIISLCVQFVLDMRNYGINEEELWESLGTAQREIMFMARMIDNVAAQSSMYDNRQDMRPLDIAFLLREEANTYRALLERNGNGLTLEIPPSLPQIYGNADMLLHVLSNLLSNANRHTHGGKVNIKSVVRDDMINVTVRDSGLGVKPELLPKVFERGVSESGSGLGLSICKTAIEAHKGTITIESEYGKGTAVTFTLPVYKPNEEEQDNG